MRSRQQPAVLSPSRPFFADLQSTPPLPFDHIINAEPLSAAPLSSSPPSSRAADGAASGSSSSLRSAARDSPWGKLVKLELSTLAATASVFGYYLAGGPILHLLSLQGAAMLSGTMLTAFSAAVLNQLLEVPYDRMMERTRRRPLVTGAISSSQAVTACAAFATSGAALLLFASGGVQAAGIALSTILLYAFVYTGLKRVSPLNTEFGALVGSLPVFVGAACAGPLSWSEWTSASSLSVLLGFAFMSAWQMPHFMMIAHQYSEQYARAGFRMRSPLSAPRVGLAWASLLCLLPFLGFHFHLTSPAFIFTGSLLNAYFVSQYARFARQPAVNRSRFFIYLYFILMFAAICLHATNNDGLQQLLTAVSTRVVALPDWLLQYRRSMPHWLQDNAAFWAVLPDSVRALCGKSLHDNIRQDGRYAAACPVHIVKEAASRQTEAGAVAAESEAAKTAATV